MRFYRSTWWIVAWLSASMAVALDDAMRLQPKWARMDQDGDGNVALTEMHPILAQAVSVHDANGDGLISLEEYVAFDLDPGGGGSLPVPGHIEWVPDLPYAGTDDPRQSLDIYRPRNRQSHQPLPVIAYIHGGGWSVGSKVGARAQLFPLLATGEFAAVSIGYRLSWQATWPAQLDDIKAALRWVRAQADVYGFDPDRICALGPSAGGHLVAMLGTTNNDPAFAGTLGSHLTQSDAVQCVADYFGPSDLRGAAANDPMGQPSSVTQLLGAPAAEVPALAARASPLVQVDAADVPFLIVHGTADPLVDYQDSVRLAAALQQAGVPVWFQTVNGAGHGQFGDARADVDARLLQFFKMQLLGAPGPLDVTALAH